jgi:predicted ATPase
VDDSHSLFDFIEESKAIAAKGALGLSCVSEVKLENFVVDDLKQMLMVLLDRDDDVAVVRLAEICYKRTHGNMFYFKSFLQALKEHGLLQFTVSSCRWHWDEEAILASTAVTGNVVDLMRRRLLELPEGVQKQLSIASCLGSSFDTSTVGIVWNTIVKARTDLDSSTDDWLETSEKHGILERVSETEYRWAHDQVQEGALSLIPEEELPNFQIMIGKALLDGLSEGKREANLFIIVDLLNSGDLDLVSVSKLEMAELHRSAATKAYRQVAVEATSHYARVGVEYLPEDAWISHYELTLELHLRGAEAASLLQEKDLLKNYAEAIFEQKDRPLTDKLPAYKAMIDNIGQEKEAEPLIEAKKMLFGLLAQLGCKFPNGKIGELLATVKLLLKTKRKLKRLKLENVGSLPRMKEPDKLRMMEIMTNHMPVVFIIAPDTLGLWFLKFAELTLEYGLCIYSSSAFAQLGILFLILNDFDTAIKCGYIAEKLTLIFDSKSVNLNTLYQINGFSLAYKRPYHKLRSALIAGYRDSLALGDITRATTVSSIVDSSRCSNAYLCKNACSISTFIVHCFLLLHEFFIW